MNGNKDTNTKKLIKFGIVFLICTVVTVIAYIVLISNELTNVYDGMWHGSYYTDYSWCVSIGRWFWSVVGAVRLHMSPEPFTTIISVMMTVLAGCIVIEWFEVKNLWKKYVIILFSVVNTSVCVWLSYRYMSPTFTVSYLLSVVSIFLIRKSQSIPRLIGALACLVISMGCYQANLGCACILILFNIIWLLQKEDDSKKVTRFATSSVVTALLSCVVYKIIWDIILKIKDIEVSAYKGTDASFIGIITSLPSTVIDSYKIFFGYFLSNDIKHDAYQEYLIYRIILLLVVVLLLVLAGRLVALKGTMRLVPFAVCCILLPLAANASFLAAQGEGGVAIQQTMPMAIVLPFFACLTGASFNSEKLNDIVKIATSALLTCLAIGSFLMVSVDQHTMLVGRGASVATINRVATDLMRSEIPQDGYIFLGRISDNPYFQKDPLWDKSNEYARYGEFFVESNGNVFSYSGLLRDAGLNLPVCWGNDYWHELEGWDEIKSMPSYPNEGYWTPVDNVVVVKLADY